MGSRKVFRFAGLGLLFIVCLFVVTPAGAQDTQKIVKYGTMHPLTGAYSVWARPATGYRASGH